VTLHKGAYRELTRDILFLGRTPYLLGEAAISHPTRSAYTSAHTHEGDDVGAPWPLAAVLPPPP